MSTLYIRGDYMRERLTEIIKCSSKGEEQHVLLLIEQFNPLINNYAYKLGYEDAKQDLILKLITAIRKINLVDYENQEGRMVSFIQTVVKNEYIRLNKRKEKLLCFEITFDEKYTRPFNQDFDSEIQMDQIISKLPKQQGKIIRELYVNQLNEGEVSRLLGITRQGVNNSKKRAFKFIKENFDMGCAML